MQMRPMSTYTSPPFMLAGGQVADASVAIDPTL